MKIWKLVTFGLTIATLFVACGKQPTDEEHTVSDAPIIENNSYEKCTLTFSWWGGDSRNAATLKAIEAFEEKYPGIEVETNYGAWINWENTVAEMFVTNTTPDVCQVNWNWLYSYSADGSVFLDLNRVSDVLDLSQFSDDALEQCVVGEKLQAIPVSMTGRIFYWNQTTFERVGIEVPKTFRELLYAGEAFKTKLGDEYYPLVLGEYDRMILMVYCLESMYGKAWVENGKLQYTMEEIQIGLEFIQLLEQEHVIPPLEILLDDGADSIDENNKWRNGTYAGVFEWDSSVIKYNSSLEPGQKIVVGNFFEDMGEYHGGYSKVSLGFAISENCEYPKEAAMLINFLLNEEEGITLMGSERGIPLSVAALEICQEKNLLDEIVAEANVKVLEWVSFPLDPKFESVSLRENIYHDVMQGLGSGKYSTKEAAHILIDGVNAELGK